LSIVCNDVLIALFISLLPSIEGSSSARLDLEMQPEEKESHKGERVEMMRMKQ